MRRLALTSFSALLPLFLVPIACGGGGPTDTSGGAPGSGGLTPGTGGATNGTGGTSSGGVTSSGGTSSTGGASSGGGTSSGGQPGSGGAGSGGAGSGGDGSGGGGNTAAVPSAGCTAGSTRPQNGILTAQNSHFFAFPEDYDGTTPMPVLFGFHGCGTVNRGDGSNPSSTEYIKLTNGTDFATEYVRAVPISADAAGGCWSYGTDIGHAKQVFDTLAEDYCIDLSRVYATGHSSGAQFIVQMLLSNHTADAEHFGFAGVAPVAASDYGAMTGPIPVMYIQGITDKERNNGDGHETVEEFVLANDCQNTSADYAPVMGCQSGSVSVDPGCIVYDGCSAPTIWCSHNDPEYGGTFHGVPCFAMDAMFDFFATLP